MDNSEKVGKSGAPAGRPVSFVVVALFCLVFTGSLNAQAHDEQTGKDSLKLKTRSLVQEMAALRDSIDRQLGLFHRDPKKGSPTGRRYKAARDLRTWRSELTDAINDLRGKNGVDDSQYTAGHETMARVRSRYKQSMVRQ